MQSENVDPSVGALPGWASKLTLSQQRPATGQPQPQQQHQQQQQARAARAHERLLDQQQWRVDALREWLSSAVVAPLAALLDSAHDDAADLLRAAGEPTAAFPPVEVAVSRGAGTGGA